MMLARESDETRSRPPSRRRNEGNRLGGESAAFSENGIGQIADDFLEGVTR